MKRLKKDPEFFFVMAIIWCSVVIGCRNNDTHTATIAPAVTDPLPSWNDGMLKRSILAYVREVTDSTDRHFIPAGERIATFDNDGTLWAEKPYVQELFAFYRVKQMIAKDPALAKKQPFKAVIENDKGWFAKGGEKTLIQLVAATHTGMTEDEFEQSVSGFFAQATVQGRPVRQIVYQPQLELLHFLRANQFKTFICTGGTIELVRGIAPEFYGIPKEQVIGTTFQYKFIDSNRSLFREPAIDHFNDKDGKPVGIQQYIGRRPVFACGNEGGAGDIAMLEYCQGSKYPSFQLLVNHDDSTREFFYQEKDNASLQAAQRFSWHVVSMKNDWKTIYVTQK